MDARVAVLVVAIAAGAGRHGDHHVPREVMLAAVDLVRRFANRVGMAAFGAAAVSAVMFFAALALGIHCPDCDRLSLGDAYGFWSAWFDVQSIVHLVAALLALPSVLIARRRKWATIALVLCILLLFKPM